MTRASLVTGMVLSWGEGERMCHIRRLSRLPEGGYGHTSDIYLIRHIPQVAVSYHLYVKVIRLSIK